MLKLNMENSGYSARDLKSFESKIKEINEEFIQKQKLEEEGENHFLGWMKLPEKYEEEELDKILNDSEKIRKNSEVLVVLGVGGSFIGAKAVISALKNREDNFDIMFLGDTLSERDMADAIKYLKSKEFSINVISKSGTTLETAVSFRILKELLKEKYKENYIDRIYITTDKEKGSLKAFAEKYNKDTYVIPDNVGGRFSVLTPVGLLPIATANIDIKKIIKGAKKAKDDLENIDINTNDSIKFALLRYLMYKKGFTNELFVNYENRLEPFNQWYVQLFAESEGKDKKGLFPSSAIFTRDLHSLGQFIQDGSKILYETILYFEEEGEPLIINEDEENLDKLNYISGKSLRHINKTALKGTIKAHVEGNVPNIYINISKLDEESLGYLIYFFEISCAYSARLIDVNPFNQPGVNGYKDNMYKLLGKDN